MVTDGGFLMSQIRHLGSRIFEKMLRESGVDAFSGAQGRILYVLWEHDRLTITQIGKMTSLAKTTLTGMLDRMETEGLVVRIPDTRNRRQIFVSITDKAKEYREEYDRLSEEMCALFYLGFSGEEIRDFEGKLRRIIQNLESK